MMLDVDRIRLDFPIFRRLINGRPIIYLDNAATSQRPQVVIDAIVSFYREYNANVHRGLHRLSDEASEAYENAHKVVARFIGAKSYREIVFLRNTTEALNMVASILAQKIGNKGNIVTTIMEHHSNFLPWLRLSQLRGLKLRVIGLTKDYRLNMEAAAELIDENTKVVAVTQASNVLGTINNVKEICKIAHENEAICVVDGAQSVPHMPVNVGRLGVDFLAFSGHKMLGPTGIGVLYGKEDLLEELDPWILGGGMIKKVSYNTKEGGTIEWAGIPWKFEAGTPNIAGAIGLVAAIKYLESVGIDNIFRHEQELVKYALDVLSDVDGVEVYGPNPDYRLGIIPFNIIGVDPHAVAIYLDEKNIAVRSGMHCAHPLHQYLGLDMGTARASLYLYNTKEEIDYFVSVIKEILGGLK